MAGLTEERLRVVAIIHALKAVGIRVKNWKNLLNGNSNSEQTLTEKNGPQRFAFGRDLHLLPQQQLSEMGGTVPQFLVEACGYLSLHLHTEGLFRKTGSLSRIRALRADLEQRKTFFRPPHADLLQPCDVASLFKQFLRELPSPLIPTDLQGPLIQAQGLVISHDQEGARTRTTLLITALIPASHARALRYICTFLRQAAERCSENRMDVNGLAVVIAPNLLQSPAQLSKLTVDTEKHLDQQAAVIKTLILHADRIGIVPSCMMEASKTTGVTDTPSPAGGAMFSKRTGLSVYRSLRRQRRRSVGEIFVDAFSKLKPSRTPTGPPISLDVMSDPPFSKSPTPQSPITVKRKATHETVPELEGSAKKRRSLHDLREDTASSISQLTEESTGVHTPLEEKSSKEDVKTCKKINQTRENWKSLRPLGQEEKAHRRKRSLRFFTMSNHISPTHKDSENGLEDHDVQFDYKSSINGDESPRVPVILIDGPEGAVVVGNEVEDDPDLLNCSFVESRNDFINSVGSEVPCVQKQESEEPCEDECWTVLEDENHAVIESVTPNEVLEFKGIEDQERVRETKPVRELSHKESKATKKKSSKNRSRPRRSISLPEVTLESCCDEISGLEKEVGTAEPEMVNRVWPLFARLTLSNDPVNKTTENQNVGSREVPGQVMTGTVKMRKKQDKMADSTLGFKRPHQRLSMAERLRSFSALTLLLRTSRAAPQFRDKPQECLQKGATRLRRQGARRFGRSISHEGVSERLRESPESSPPANQAFIGICDASPDSGVESVDHELISYLHREEGCKRSQYSPKSQPIIDGNVGCVLARAERNQESEVDKDEFQSSSEKSEQLNKPTLDVEESDLHKLDDQKKHDRDSGVRFHLEEHQVLTPDSTSPTFFQQMAPLNPFGDASPDEDEVSPLPTTEENPSWLYASPTFQFPPCKAFGSLVLDDVISEDDERLSYEMSPPAFHFRPPTTRRRYRDSPRWPSHEVRMSAWNPLPL
ncbi:Rho GTPase-activating protein 11A [Triplophysa tibetana]|uniref:Rho GTPase-activating protein 11A n=1 Tax=Triplophysa tibetana TaxID=1572043 RepID=A0A5A9N348_9TELE|nr:Rho GTPase-activating protein 11A [Triplophysa tibetana]